MLLNFLFRHEKKIIGTTAVLLFLITWELAAAYRLVNPIFLSSPMRVWNAAADLAETGELWMHMQVSGAEFFVGYFISAILGVPLGICLGWYRRFNYAFDPFVNALYAAPRVVGTKPGRIRDTITIDLARPRALSIKRDPKFLAYEDRIWALIEEEAKKNIISEQVA
jgi:hypothetical protein